MEILDLIKVGSKVKINPNLSSDRLSSSTFDTLNTSSDYIVKDFKLTDGKGIGVVLELKNGKKEWFFENEIEIFDEEGQKINFPTSESQNINLYSLGLKDLKYRLINPPKRLLNPLNFLSWLLYSIKDTI